MEMWYVDVVEYAGNFGLVYSSASFFMLFSIHIIEIISSSI